MIEDLLQHSVDTFRNRATGVGAQKAYEQNLVGVPCLIQPVSASFAQTTGNVFGRTYNLFLPIGVDIEMGDKLDDGFKQYSCNGSLKRNYGQDVQHVTLIIVEEPRTIVPSDQ